MILYKYLHPDRIDVLQNCWIRYTQPEVFNDPFEVKSYIAKISEKLVVENMLKEVIPEVLREFAQTRGLENSAAVLKKMDKIIPTIKEKLAANFDCMIGILCLTERADNLLMWAHYAASHEGYVIGFDTSHPYFQEQAALKDEFSYLRKVDYRENRILAPMLELAGTDVLLVKSTQWEYEQEWRVIRRLQDADEVKATEPFPIHLFRFPTDAVREVILGCRMPAGKRKEVMSLLSSDTYKHIRILQAETSETQFKLSFYPVR